MDDAIDFFLIPNYLRDFIISFFFSLVVTCIYKFEWQISVLCQRGKRKIFGLFSDALLEWKIINESNWGLRAKWISLSGLSKIILLSISFIQNFKIHNHFSLIVHLLGWFKWYWNSGFLFRSTFIWLRRTIYHRETSVRLHRRNEFVVSCKIRFREHCNCSFQKNFILNRHLKKSGFNTSYYYSF